MTFGQDELLIIKCSDSGEVQPAFRHEAFVGNNQ